jgi:uncharacterized SAM-binding protein YcdF (DUF218 family)
MAKVLRALIPIAGITAVALTAGFYVFVGRVSSYAAIRGPRAADGIVVLTGGEDRINAGIGLLAGRLGTRLLISGVHPLNSTPVELGHRIGGNLAMYKCCVDLGHGALDTAGNAAEARGWVQNWGFRSLIVVTSSYHMPRSLAEFERVMPDVTLIPHPVTSRHFALESWWRHYPTARLLASEYLKYLTSAARLGLARITGTLDRPTVARPGSAGGPSTI